MPPSTYKTWPLTKSDALEAKKTDGPAKSIGSPQVIPDMIEKGGGKIINICSMMSELGRETVSAYAAAKGGLKMLTKNIASEYGYNLVQFHYIGYCIDRIQKRCFSSAFLIRLLPQHKH